MKDKLQYYENQLLKHIYTQLHLALHLCGDNFIIEFEKYGI